MIIIDALESIIAISLVLTIAYAFRDYLESILDSIKGLI